MALDHLHYSFTSKLKNTRVKGENRYERFAEKNIGNFHGGKANM